jgi:hypothetical protein
LAPARPDRAVAQGGRNVPATVRRRHTEKAAYWLDFCRRYVIKQADLGGDGQDLPFEQAFSNLAHAYLRDKAPGLLDYEVGFQLVDRNEDNSKAIGIFGFKVGSQWIYAPVFFLNGDLKGHELLYIKNQDAFVPLKENWINYLLNKKPVSLGEGVNKDTKQLGVRQPDFQRIIHSPVSSKTAQALPSWLAHAMPGLAYAAVTNPHSDSRYNGMAHLPDVVKAAGDCGVRWLNRFVEAYPTLATALESFYGASLGDAIAAVKTAEAGRRHESRSLLGPVTPPTLPQPPGRLLDFGPPLKRGSVQVINYDPARNDRLRAMTDDDRLALMRDGYKVIDNRRDEETSRAFRGDVPVTAKRNVVNPTETGLYDTLVKPGEYAKMVVIIGPHGPSGRRNYALALLAEDSAAKRGWVALHPSYIWVGKQYSDDDFRTWVEKVGTPSSDGVATEEDKQFVLLGADGSGTLPFIVEGEVGDPDGSYKIYKVRFDLYSDKPRQAYQLGQDNQRWQAMELARNEEVFDRWNDGERIHLGGRRGAKLRSAQGDLFVPKTMFVVEVEPADYEDEQWKAPEFDKDNLKRKVISLTGGQGKSKTPPLVPMANLPDADLGVYTKTAALTVRYDGAGGYIDGGPHRSKVQLLSDLIVTHGLREKVARQILAECEEGRFKIGGPVRRYRIVYPDGFEKGAITGDYGGAGLAGQGPSAPGFPEPPTGADDFMASGTRTVLPQELGIPVQGMQADPSARDAYRLMGPDPRAARVAQQAAQVGQREIFDTAAVGSLLKATRDDQLSDRFIGDLMKGLDRVGRILFLLYWHQDQFAERYGKEEIPELEDSLRNSFEDLGDLVLFLKQKSVDADPRAEAQHIDLKEMADS